MIKLKFNRANREKITGALSEAQKGCTERTLTFMDVTLAINDANHRLADLGIAKSRRKGAELSITPFFKLPGSYSKSSSYTRVRLERSATGWFVNEIGRLQGNSDFGSRLYITTEQRDAIPSVFKL